MRYTIIITFMIACCSTIFSQEIGAQEKIEWLQNLYQHGVEMTDDSIHISQEVLALMENHEQRTAFFANQKNWSVTVEYIKEEKLKEAFWNMINLYAINEYSRNKVLKTIIVYDQMFDMEEVLISTFYTFCYLDSEIGYIEDGKPTIEAPHILEQKLQAVKEMIYYTNTFTDSNNG